MMKILTSQDIYGHAIGVHYDGEDTHKTRLGGVLTIVTYILGLINTYNLVLQFVDKSEQKEDYSKIQVDSHEMERQSLKEKEFSISMVPNQQLSSNVGRWKAYQVYSSW